MKKLILISMFVFLFCSVGWTAEDVVLPYNVVVSDPLTDKAARLDVSFTWNPGQNYCMIRYELWSNDRLELLEKQTVRLEGSDFIDFVDGYGATLQTRANAVINTDIQSKHATQAKP
jgi:hypothetical protein